MSKTNINLNKSLTSKQLLDLLKQHTSMQIHITNQVLNKSCAEKTDLTKTQILGSKTFELLQWIF
jgi:hypothetical protein